MDDGACVSPLETLVVVALSQSNLRDFFVKTSTFWKWTVQEMTLNRLDIPKFIEKSSKRTNEKKVMFHCKTRSGFSLIKHVESKFSPRPTKFILDIISWHVFSRLNRYFLSKLCYFLIQSCEELIRMIILLYVEQVIQKMHWTECALHKIIESKIKIFSAACCLWYYGESSLKHVHKQSTFWLLLYFNVLFDFKSAVSSSHSSKKRIKDAKRM